MGGSKNFVLLSCYLKYRPSSDKIVQIFEKHRREENMGKISDELIYEILSVVEEIPYGKVASYGQIAKLIGRERNARLVGKALSMADLYGEYPCHRVVNHAGRTAPFFREQKERLLAEGVAFQDNGCVDMEHFQWKT